MTFLIPVWMTLAALGGGLAVLRAVGLFGVLSQTERCATAFVLGVGVMGWLVFFPGWAGWFGAPAFAVILAVMPGGLLYLRAPAPATAPAAPMSWIEWGLVIGIGAMMLMDLGEGLAPAADADTLAYHFETPRRYLLAGDVFTIPRAVDGATQLLLHMTYAVALGLGGKAAVPLWTMLSGWALGAIFYAIARRHMNRMWSLGGTLLLLTTPAIVYGAGTGQVEARIAAFALLSAYAAVMSLRETGDRSKQIGWAVLAGIAAGFFAGAKMTGLIFAFVTCLSLMGGTQTVRRMAVFSAAAAVCGAQWYIFNWAETGDPIYPMLWRFFDLAPGYPWNAAIDAALQRAWALDTPTPRTIGWFLAYPLRTVIAPLPTFEALLTGPGAAILVLLPFAALAFAHRRDAAQSPLARLLVIGFLFYAIWFFFGPSLRVRHLIAVYPLLLLCVLAGASRFLQPRDRLRTLVLSAMAALIAVQLGGQAVFSKKYVSYLASDATPSAFLKGNVSGYPVVPWLNSHLTQQDRVMVLKREWLYLLDVPYYFAHSNYQNLISLYAGADDVDRLIAQLNAQGITHIAIGQNLLSAQNRSTITRLMAGLERAGCLSRLAEIESAVFSSRTLPAPERESDTFVILKFADCAR